MGKIDDVVGDVAPDAGNGHRLAAKRFGEPHRIGQPVALFVGQLQAAPRFDADRGPWCMDPVRQPSGVAHEAGGTRILADAHQDALARRPRAGDRIGLHMRQQLLVDALGRPPQCQLAQCGQVARREIMLQRALGLLGDVDLAFLQPLDQIVRCEVNQFDRVRPIEHLVRHGFAHPHMRDLGDHVVEALDVLDVDSGVDVDTAREQLLGVEIALGMPAAGGIGVREFVDQRDLRPTRDDRIEVHLLEDLISVFESLARNDFEPPQQPFRFRTPVGLDHANDHIDAGFCLGVRAQQHLVSLADAGGGADENLEPAGLTALAPRRFQERVRRGSFFKVAALIGHKAL